MFKLLELHKKDSYHTAGPWCPGDIFEVWEPSFRTESGFWFGKARVSKRSLDITFYAAKMEEIIDHT